MSQETFKSRTTPNVPSSWFPTRPPRGYNALPCDGPEDHTEVELHPLKPASHIKAAPTTDRHCNRTCCGSSTLRELLMFLGFLAVSTLVFSACAWLAGMLLLGSPTSSGPPYDHTESSSVSVLNVLAVGSLVAALAPCAIVLLIFLHHGSLSQNSEMGGQTAARAMARAKIRVAALVVFVVLALCVAVGAGLTTHALMST